MDKNLSYAIHRLEDETGHYIDGHYPYFKFISKMKYYRVRDLHEIAARKNTKKK